MNIKSPKTCPTCKALWVWIEEEQRYQHLWSTPSNDPEKSICGRRIGSEIDLKSLVCDNRPDPFNKVCINPISNGNFNHLPKGDTWEKRRGDIDSLLKQSTDGMDGDYQPMDYTKIARELLSETRIRT